MGQTAGRSGAGAGARGQPRGGPDPASPIRAKRWSCCRIGSGFVACPRRPVARQHRCRPGARRLLLNSRVRAARRWRFYRRLATWALRSRSRRPNRVFAGICCGDCAQRRARKCARLYRSARGHACASACASQAGTNCQLREDFETSVASVCSGACQHLVVGGEAATGAATWDAHPNRQEAPGESLVWRCAIRKPNQLPLSCLPGY